jgi:hypothetical protein
VSLLLYAVVPAEAADVLGRKRLDWRPRVCVRGAVGVAYEPVERPPEPRQEVVLEYGRRQGDLGELVGTTLPVRFGSLVPDESALRQLLADRAATWARRLAQVDGCVEIVVHARGRDVAAGAPPAATSGRSYLERRARERRAAGTLAQELHDLLGPVVREERALPGEAGAGRLACLVPREEVDAVTGLVSAWGAEHGREARVTGPFPVLDFAEEPQP